MSVNQRTRSWRRAAAALVAAGAAGTLVSSFAFAARVTSIGFNGQGDSSVIEIRGDGPLTAEKQENTQDKQVVIELKGASLAKTASRALDTSSFNSKVSLVSPYKVSGGSRVVVQLRDNASAEMTQDGNTVRLKIANPGGGETGSASTADAATGAPAAAASATATDTTASSAASAAAGDGTSDVKKVDESAASAAADLGAPPPRPKDRMDEFLEARETRQFHGRPITLQARDADLVDIFRLIGEASGFNIIVGEEVKGKAPPISLVDVPWDQALDVLLRTKRLGAERSGSVLRITTLTALTLERQDELKARIAADASSPRVTRVFPISYAALDELQGILTKFATVNQASIGATGTSGSAAAPVQSGIVTADKRTNSLIVNDTPENIERARKLIEVLDTQTPQVLIEAKVVETDETGSNAISGAIGTSNYTNGQTGALSTPPFFGEANGGLALDPLLGAPGPNTSSSILAGTGTSPLNQLGIGLNFLPSIKQLNATLNFLESEQHLETIASPRSVVLNKEHSNIIQSTPVSLTTVTVTATGTTTTSTITQANLSLDVTPTVTNEGSVILKLTLHRDIPVSVTGGQAVSSRSVDTTVLVESGSTLVIGGIYTANKQHLDSGVPFLKDIPILGWLFGSRSDESDHSELIFFLTPRILNIKEAGLS